MDLTKVNNILFDNDEESKRSNSNKNTTMIGTSRCVAIEEYVKELSLDNLPEDIKQAHLNWEIYIHDLWFWMMPFINCCLINLQDMLDNGTVLNEIKIESPKSFQTACNLTIQFMFWLASMMYGGKTIPIHALSKYLKITEDKLKEKYKDENIVKQLLADELKSGIQTMYYQTLTLISNQDGQWIFSTWYLEFREDDPYLKYTKMIIDEILKQKIKGMPNAQGIPHSTAMPKLVMLLNPLLINEYKDTYKLALECISKRSMPDFVSEKILKKNHNGQTFWPMWCVHGEEVSIFKYKWKTYSLPFKLMWNMFENIFNVESHKWWEHIILEWVQILDRWKFVKCRSIIKNKTNKRVEIKFSNWRILTCTPDHPLPIINKWRTFAEDLEEGDSLLKTSMFIVWENNSSTPYPRLQWAFICDWCYDHQYAAYFDIKWEDDIVERFEKESKEYLPYLKIETVPYYRWVCWNYYRVKWTWASSKVMCFFEQLFNWLQKIHRNLPENFLDWSINDRYELLWGVIDADWYINPKQKTVQMGSTNKKLAIQMMYLCESLWYETKIYINHYNKNDLSKVRYRIEFIPDEILLKHITSEKKRNCYSEWKTYKKFDYISVTAIEEIELDMEEDSYDVTTESDRFDVSGVSSHNCRSFLSDRQDERWEYKYWWRFNRWVASINIPRIAFECKEEGKDFFTTLKERAELCKKVLEWRTELLRWTKAERLPLLFMWGAIARLEASDVIDPYLEWGYSTASLGYVGIHEALMILYGYGIETEEGHNKAIEIVQALKNYCDEWNAEKNMGYSVYWTPAETLVYKFNQIDKAKYGSKPEYENIFKHEYYTNSFHINVRTEIDAFNKLKKEADFQTLSSGWCISFIECGDLTKNLPALDTLSWFMYNTCQYAEFNMSNMDVCSTCNFVGKLDIEDNRWKCPQCGEKDLRKLVWTRRICWYLTTNLPNKGKMNELLERVYHI